MGDKELAQAPEQDRGCHQKKLQHAARRRGLQPLEAGIVEPGQQERGEGRWRAGPEDQRHVDDREGEGEHRIDRQTELAVEQRQNHFQPGRGGAVAEAAGDVEEAGDRKLVRAGDNGEQQEGRLLQPEPGGEREAEAVAGDRQIGRQAAARHQRGSQAHEPAARRDQKGKADGEPRMRYRKQRGQQAAEPGEETRALESRRQAERGEEGEECRQQAADESRRQRAR